MVRRIGFIGYNGISALDLIGPMEVFHTANTLGDARRPAYEILILADHSIPFLSEAGIAITPTMTLRKAPILDTIIVPGGEGIRRPENFGPIVAWLKKRARTRRIASVCTGIHALGESGLIDGRRATTHWRFAADVARRFPSAKLDCDAIYVGDGNIFTSAGVTAGIDLALAFVEQDLGGQHALKVARELVVYLKRDGGQLQFSEPLRFQSRATDRFADVAAYIVTNLKNDLSIEALASRTGLCARQFSRRFRVAFGVSPGAYVEQLRLDEARRRFPAGNHTVDSIAASVGYASADSFRRAFERRFGVAPSKYRERFTTGRSGR